MNVFKYAPLWLICVLTKLFAERDDVVEDVDGEIES